MRECSGRPSIDRREERGRERGSGSGLAWIGGLVVLVTLGVVLFVRTPAPLSSKEPGRDRSRVGTRPHEAIPPGPGFKPSRSAPEPGGHVRTEGAASPTRGTAPGRATAWGSIEGQVVSDSGAPIAGARVTGVHPSGGEFPLRGGPEIEVGADPAITDAAGAFHVELPADARYDLWVDAVGHPRLQRGRFAVFEDEVTRAGELKMSAGATIFGTVSDPTGRPIAGARISTTLAGPQALETTADAQGRYELTGLPLGGIVLFAEAAGFAPLRGRWESIEQAGGREEVPLVLSPAGTVSGVVSNEEGTPLRATVHFQRDGDRQDAAAEDGGRFRISTLVAGERYEMGVWAHGYQRVVLEVIPATDAPEQIVTMKRAPGVMVVIRDAERGLPIDGAEVSVIDSAGANRSRYRTSGNEPPGHIWVTLEQAGTWTLRVLAADYEPGEVNSVTTDGVTAGAVVEVALVPKAEVGNIYLLVRDEVTGAAISGARLGALARREPSVSTLFGVPVRNNGVEVRDLGAGSTGADGRIDLAPDRIPSGHSLAVDAEGYITAEVALDRMVATSAEDPRVISLDRGAVLRGRVTEGGAPVRDHPVVLWSEAAASQVVRTGVDGTFRADSLAPGAWFAAPGNIYEAPRVNVGWDTEDAILAAHARPPIVLGAGEERAVVLEILDSGASIRGTVRVDGEPRMSLCARIAKNRVGPSGEPETLWSREAWTGPSGGFALTGLPAGEYEVAILSARRTATYWSRSFVLAPTDRHDLDIDVETAQLTGTVRRAIGQEFLSGTVWVEVLGENAGSARIEADGTYRIKDLPASFANAVARTGDLGTIAQPIQLHPGMNALDLDLWPVGSLDVALPSRPADTASILWLAERNGVKIGSARANESPWTGSTSVMRLEGMSPGRVTIKVTVLTPADPNVEGDQGSIQQFIGEGEVLSAQTTAISVRPDGGG